MKTSGHTRRSLLGRFIAFSGAWLLGSQASAAQLTPQATEGPFYPTRSMRMDDIDNDLVKVAGFVQEAGGEVIHLNGRVLDRNDQLLEGMRVEIWQCDVNGKYLHSGDRRNVAYDTGFQGFGHDITGPDGTYHFRTIKPTVYPGRTPHIHVKVFDENSEVLTTQFYLHGHPGNARDRIFNSLSEADKTKLSMAFSKVSGTQETSVDIVV